MICFLEDSKILLVQTQFVEMGVVSLKLYVFLKIYTACKVGNGFYWLDYFHCKYMTAQRFESACLLTKIRYLRRHSFQKWT